MWDSQCYLQRTRVEALNETESLGLRVAHWETPEHGTELVVLHRNSREISDTTSDESILQIIESLRQDGNRAFALKQWLAASRCYMSARDAWGFVQAQTEEGRRLVARVESNLSLSLTKIGYVQDALTAAQSAVNLCPSWRKAHLRVAAALERLGRQQEAKCLAEKWKT
jgi:tetratricopeptide (TPR) repeat protein